MTNLHSIWHQIHHRYEQEFDPAAYLRSCEKHLASDWSYGEPLIAAAISRGDLAQAESIVERTFMSLLRAKEICSHYQRHAALMKALCEVNRANYDRILTEWKTAHRRRRNLWTEMANFKLPNLDR